MLVKSDRHSVQAHGSTDKMNSGSSNAISEAQNVFTIYIETQ
jgi:hypothetical protein